MVKQRLTSADIAAEVSCLRSRIIGLRVANVYDINAKTYVLKLARSGEDGEKVFLLIESGARMHTIEGMPVKGDTPSNFTLKLRKHMRTRRVASIRQLGIDRMVQLTFGTGEAAHHLILEFFAQGNVVLTDAQYGILTLLRSHRDDAAGLVIMAAHPYPVHAVRARRGRQAPAAGLAAELRREADGAAGEGSGAARGALKDALGRALPYGPAVAEHVARVAGLDPDAPLATGLSDDALAALTAAAATYERWLAGTEAAPPAGYILFAPGSTEVYDSVEPLLLEQHAGRHVVDFGSFDAAMQTFFGKMSGQRAVVAKASKEKAAHGKLEAVQRDAAARLVALAGEVESSEGTARRIEANAELVEAALASVREALAGGLDWSALGKLVREEATAGNPIAAAIDSLNLDKGQVTLLLPDAGGDDAAAEATGEEEEGTAAGEAGRHGRARRQVAKVTVDLALSAHGNARFYYDARRKHQAKRERTLAASDKAIKAAERKAAAQLKQVHAAPVAAIARKPHWFERFHWFISSENYLVVSGRDAQQNELLVKRYMKKGDVYCHADLHGASSTIVKNHRPEVPIPPLTLAQAGAGCVCRSAAWNSKVVTSAWWVHPEQVSQTAPTGEYLTTGSFMIRGRKNYLPPQPLVVGFGLLFRVEDSCIAAHLGERAVKSGQDGEEDDAYVAANMRHAPLAPSEPAPGHEGEEEESPRPDPLAAFMDSGLEALPSLGGKGQGGRGGAAATQDLQAQFQRYGLGERPGAGAEVHGAGPDAGLAQGGRQGGRAVRHLSAKERQALKAGTPGAEAGPGQRGGGRASAAAAPAVERGQGASARRGKKVGGKYGDDEDAELARQALQSGGPTKSRRQRKEEHKAKLAAKKTAQNTVTAKPVTADDIARVFDAQFEELAGEEREEEAWEEEREGGSDGHGDGSAIAPGTREGEPEDDAACPEAQTCEPEAGAGVSVHADDGEPEGGQAGNVDDAREVAALLQEENIQLLDEEDRLRLTDLDALTGLPRPDDVLLYALPVCAPYQVLTSYKFKVKMVPGPQKKGKAVRQAMELFQRAADTTSRERDLCRAVPEPEAVITLVGTVKIQAAGTQKLKQAVQQQKKKK
uniref:Nuclear export mediator factor NEMF n=1 Tax=Auxenochlorella protothecoides TaxID=3075 RepID=A0A1D2A0E9_AUXPR